MLLVRRFRFIFRQAARLSAWRLIGWGRVGSGVWEREIACPMHPIPDRDRNKGTFYFLAIDDLDQHFSPALGGRFVRIGRLIFRCHLIRRILQMKFESRNSKQIQNSKSQKTQSDEAVRRRSRPVLLNAILSVDASLLLPSSAAR